MTDITRLRELADLAAAWDQYELAGEAPAPLSLFDMQAALREAATELETLRAREGEMRGALRAIMDVYVKAPGWAAPILTGEDARKMYRIAADIALLTPASPGEGIDNG